MPIPFRCQQCNATGKAGSKFAGQLIHCPRCKAMVRVPASLEEVEASKPQPIAVAEDVETLAWPEGPPPPPVSPPKPPAEEPQKFVEVSPSPPSPPSPPSTATNRFPRWAGWVTAGLVVVFLVTLHSPSDGEGVLAHYAAIIACGGVLGFGFASRKGIGWLYGAGIAAGIAAAIFWWQWDYGIHTWFDVDKDGIESRFTDWTHRGASHPFYREVDYDDDFGRHTLKVFFSESGKLHGPSSHHVWMPKKDKISSLKAYGFKVDSWGIGADQDEWFWYGEPITEGEWHLRNR